MTHTAPTSSEGQTTVPERCGRRGPSLVKVSARSIIPGMERTSDPGSARERRPAARAKKRIVLSTFGSLGDLYPYLAIALGLKQRGHLPIIASSTAYRQTIEGFGLEFHPMRPDIPDPSQMPDKMRRVMDQRQGTEVVLKEWILPALPDSFDDLMSAAEGADLLVSHLLTFATPLVAELRGIPWVSTVLQPSVYFSAYDPPLFPQTKPFAKMPFLGPWFWRRYRRLVHRVTRPWFAPLSALRAELGMPPTDIDPLLDSHSPSLDLALFSSTLAQRQPDWPKSTVITGFPFLTSPDAAALSPELETFLANGSAPIVFTLGSSAVMTPGAFYDISAEAASRLGRRAILLVGKAAAVNPQPSSNDVLAVEYVPHAAIFPRAAAIVHQGGIGTTAEAMRSGRPMVVVPFAHDQPDNARRVEHLGISRTIPRQRYTVKRAMSDLRSVLEDPIYAQRASDLGRRIRTEDGVGTACTTLEHVLREN
jgi:rhamnosyltransferase subunit B